MISRIQDMAKPVRVSAIAFVPGLPPESALNDLHKGLREVVSLAASDKPDIVCLPEAVNLLGRKDWNAAAEPVPGPTSDTLAQLAREHSMYVWCPLIIKEADVCFNAAVLLDRKGEVVGAYHKMFPTRDELNHGIVPGRKEVIFETDFGRVAACICFDVQFRPVVERLGTNPPDILFFPSMFVAERILEAWAVEFGFFVVSCCDNWSLILDRLGRKVAETGRRFESVANGFIPPIASAVLNLDSRVFHYDGNQAVVKDIRRRYGAGVHFDYAQSEAVFCMSSEIVARTVNDIMREFEMEPREEYLARSRMLCEDARANQRS